MSISEEYSIPHPHPQDPVLSVGKIIRDLRRQRGLTGKMLGVKTHMSQSKISKIETGFYARLAPSDIEHILNILEAPKRITQQILPAIESTAASYTVRKAAARWVNIATILKNERETKQLRMFLFQMIPAILQIPEYRKALMKHYDLSEPHDDVTMKRQDLLWDGHHKYHVILHEMALYTVISERRVHLAQLDRLERFVGTEYVKLGIVPLQAGLIPLENSAFVLYDEKVLMFILGGTDVQVEEPLTINEHILMFKAIDQKACYDVEARELIHKAMDYFNQI